MKVLNIIIYFLLAFVFSLLDTSVLSFMPIFSATILLTISVLITLSLLGLKEQSLIFAIFSVLFYAAFSSLSVYFLVIFFLAIPFAILRLKKMAFFESNYLLVILTFVLLFLFFSLAIFILNSEISVQMLAVVATFVAINTLAGLIIYFLTKMIRRHFVLSEK